MIPSGRLVVLACAAFAVSCVWFFVPSLWGPLLAFDAVVVLFAGADLARSGGDVRVRRSAAPIQSVGAWFDVTLWVQWLGPSDAVVRVDDDAPGETQGLPAGGRIPSQGAVEVTYKRMLPVRGRVVFGPVTVRWLSPWGLWWRQRRERPADDHDVRVYPDFSHLRDHGLQARAAERRMPVRARRRPGGDSEFQRLRQYVPGDPYRHIDWKATARRQRFVSREYGQESNQTIMFMLDAGRGMTMQLGELTAFDHALNAALSMGHAALQHGDRVGMLAFDRQVRAWLPPRGGARSGASLIRATYDVFPSLYEPNYALAFRHLATRVRRRSLVVLITAMADEVNAAASTAVVKALAGRHLPLVVWLRDPSLDDSVQAPVHDAHGFYQRAASAALVGWREEALATWRRAGALVVDVAPDDLSSALLGRYLEIKARKLL